MSRLLCWFACTMRVQSNHEVDSGPAGSSDTGSFSDDLELDFAQVCEVWQKDHEQPVKNLYDAMSGIAEAVEENHARLPVTLRGIG